ncbi:MAG TPA: EAL domain-containing protein [Steroidobacteraceae bacterium]|nr:EAL domain-containing protein [Steroidobacteraceae bacterium]
MSDTSAIPLIVLSRQQDPVETINSTLRNAGHPVHCNWVRDLADLRDALAGGAPHLIFLCLNEADEIAAALDARSRFASNVPAILVRDTLGEGDLEQSVELGLQDVVTLASRRRLQAVATRELHSARLDNALSGTLATARQYREQMRAFMSGSADAIAHVQEGIVVDVNPAWAELLGHDDASLLLGQPLMDSFDSTSHTALRGALVAAAQGRWTDHSLSVVAVLPGGEPLPLDIEFERFDFEGDPAVRLTVSSQKRDFETLNRQLEEAVQRDPATGLLNRHTFFSLAENRAGQPLKGGQRTVAYLEPDRLQELEAEHGPILLEEMIERVASAVRGLLQPGDLAGRISPHGVAMLIERGNSRDLQAWLGMVLQRLAAAPLALGAQTVAVTASAGAAPCLAQGEPLARPLEDAIEAQRGANRAGGNRLIRLELPGAGRPALDEADRTWAAQIKSALMANRFRLIQQPVASLLGDGGPMFDLVVRMLDEAGQEVLPSEFLAAAERTDLLKNIDRWVVGAAMSFCAAHHPRKVFVRLSRDSIHDQTLGSWLQQQLKASGVEANQVVVELSEELVVGQPRDARTLQGLLAALGIELAIEHFGASDADHAALLTRVAANYVKIDGSLMQGLANDHALQQRVKALVELARQHHARTVAERVEDANTMAVLWQLGVEFVQGYFVNNPEQVTMG